MATVDILQDTLEIVMTDVVKAVDDYIKGGKASCVYNKELLDNTITLLISTRRVQLFNRGVI